jgi:hypothetical protein
MAVGATLPCVVRSFLCLFDHSSGSGALVILPEDRSVGQAIDTYFVVMVLNSIRRSPMIITRQAVYFQRELILASHGPSPKWCSNSSPRSGEDLDFGVAIGMRGRRVC